MHRLAASTLRAEDLVTIHQESTADHGGITLVAVKAFAVPVAFLERYELCAANTCK